MLFDFASDELYFVNLKPIKVASVHLRASNDCTRRVERGDVVVGKSEPFPALENVVSLLSTGPVGPSDKINCSDVKLIMR